jgi:hypothetical protein
MGLAAAEESAGVYRRLAVANPDVHEPDLAISLNNLSVRYGEAGRRAEGLAAITEAVAIGRRLALADPDAYESDLAISLDILSDRYGEADRQVIAIAAFVVLLVTGMQGFVSWLRLSRARGRTSSSTDTPASATPEVAHVPASPEVSTQENEASGHARLFGVQDGELIVHEDGPGQPTVPSRPRPAEQSAQHPSRLQQRSQGQRRGLRRAGRQPARAPPAGRRAES